MSAAAIDVLCCAAGEIDAALLARYENLLCAEELTRLRSFRSPAAAKEFLAGRALLRTALAERVNCDPRQLQFAKNADGKPSLVFPVSDWQFNLTHSHEWIALALCEGSAVGVDVESYRRSNNLPGIAKRFFSAAENVHLARCNDSEWAELFFAIWTLKEAHAKALGCGLPKILNCCSVDVNMAAGTIDFALSAAATAPAPVSSWLFTFGECALAVVTHGERFAAPNFSRCVPLQSIERFDLKMMARGLNPVDRTSLNPPSPPFD